MSMSRDGTWTLQWYGIPDELSPKQKAFMKKHELGFSSGYIGILRCYRGKNQNQTVWQSESAMNIVALATPRNIETSLSLGIKRKWPFPFAEDLKEQGLTWLNELMVLPDDELKRRLKQEVSLF